ncbi:MAG TPA: 4Fe-4S ferredoxin [Deltaproteobacteria bacterium]|nr:4Fe-4S ferredoxin [Deltaproteobacteria bacterium]
MCEFCVKHGEGKKWYLQARNYSEDLLSDARRRTFIIDFLSDPDRLRKSVTQLDRFDRLPGFLRGAIGRLISRKMKRSHFGQVVPIEDIEAIFGMVNSITRLACLCRSITLGQEKRYCYAVSLGPDGGRLENIFDGLGKTFFGGPDGAGLERLAREEALSAMKSHEREGLCHTVWTFETPFIAAICNCDRTDCLGLRSTLTHGVRVLFRSEYIATVDPDRCTGCRECMRLCQFGALSFSAARKQVMIDKRLCYGCGVCRSGCSRGALSLVDRSTVPSVARLW